MVGAVRKGSLQTDSRFIVEFGDAIEVEGTSAELQELSSAMKMPLVRPAMMETIETFAGDKGEGQVMAELVIGADSSLIGQTIRSAQVIDRYGVAIMGLHHPEQAFFPGRSRADAERLEVGDVLWVQGGSAALEQIQISEGTMILEGAAEIPRTAKAGLALLIFAGVVLLAALHLVPIAVAALAGSIVMLATGRVKFDRLGQALSAKVIVLVAASIALGRALLETSAAEWLGSSLALGMQGFPGAVVLAIMMAFATLLTNFSSNTAAAAVGAPIAVSLAEKLAIPAEEPLVLAVLFGCNLCYATPIAYQTNILIMSAGGYHFRDYVRAGLPLVLLMIGTLSVLLVWKYQL
ncbi:SLC13 family permease [Novosphingobium sp. MBES04]|uniref:SLC13 family permease n=1 Tax=Novosphingobium sp. MBES04 TaxID=1206458 RepID=UPI00069460AA|nr:SLC13 family permease [Novosphingobium sp. MBES04]